MIWSAASQRAAQLEAQGPPEEEADELSESDSFTLTSYSPASSPRPRAKKKSARLTGKEAEDLRAQEEFGRAHLGWGGKCP